MRVFRQIARVFGLACVAIAALAAAVLLALQTSAAKRWIAREVNARVASVEVGRISGLLPIRLRIDRVALRDGNGLWAEGTAITARISVRAAARGEFVVGTLSAERVAIHRRPVPRARTETRARIAVPETPVPARILDLRIGHLVLGEAREEIAVTGFADLATGRVARLSVTAERNGESPARLRVDGTARGDEFLARVDLSGASGRLALESDVSMAGGRIAVTNLAFTANGIVVTGAGEMRPGDRSGRASLAARVEDPGRFAAVPGDLAREPLRVALDVQVEDGRGSIRMGGPIGLAATGQIERADGGVAAVLVFTNAPLHVLGAGRRVGVEGRAHGEFRVTGPLADPSVEGWAELSGGGALTQPPRRLDLSAARLAWSAGAGRARLSYDVRSDVVGRVEGEAEVPVRLGFVPWRFGMPRDPDTRIAVRAEADVNRLAAFLRNDDGLDVRGRMTVNVDARGEPARPSITGFVEIVDLELDNPATGTSLREGHVRLEGDAGLLRIAEARVRDRSGGQIALGGMVSMDSAAGFPLAVTGALVRADVYGTPRVNANLDGAIALEGSLREPRLEGRLVPRDLDIRLLRSKPRGVALTRVDIDASGDGVAVPGPVGPTWRDRLALDLRVEMEDRFRVTGRGLASEWRGQLRVQGTARDPRIAGRLQLARGRQMFLGRRFDLTSGSLQWSGSPPEEMVLDLTAESRAADVTAQVRVAGPVATPTIDLSSDPPMPTDEILARILFGRGVDTITPFQAVMLANGVRQLQGGGSVSMLERGKEWLGVDQVGITQASGEGDSAVTGVSVGKYVNDRVYVFGEKGVGEAEDRVTVSFELSPSLSLETESSPRIREGIRLRWRRDF